MAEIIELTELTGVKIRCRCGSLTWYLFTDDADQECTLITAIKCKKCKTVVRVRGNEKFSSGG
jgi:hypothetical protein